MSYGLYHAKNSGVQILSPHGTFLFATVFYCCKRGNKLFLAL